MKNPMISEEALRDDAVRQMSGLAGWLLGRLGARSRPRPKLALLERITLAPRQTLSLVEADGRRLLIATSPEGAPAFYALDESRRSRPTAPRPGAARTSW
jgi:hypothetical protein